MRILALCTLVVMIVAAAGCDEPEEVTSGAVSLTPTQSPTPAPSAQPIESPSTQPSAPPISGEVPTGWLSFTDPSSGLTFAYPPDLVAQELPGGAGGGLNQQVFDFRSRDDPSRAVSLVVSNNDGALSPTDWALTYTACLPKTVASTVVSGMTAVSCTEQATELPNAAIIFDLAGRIYYFGSTLPESEFEIVTASIRI